MYNWKASHWIMGLLRMLMRWGTKSGRENNFFSASSRFSFLEMGKTVARNIDYGEISVSVFIIFGLGALCFWETKLQGESEAHRRSCLLIHIFIFIFFFFFIIRFVLYQRAFTVRWNRWEEIEEKKFTKMSEKKNP